MNNYQLNNTSVYLGGQCKWDLVLERSENDVNALIVKEFHLSPLSSVISFYIDPDINPLNYDHGYNLRTFYEATKGTFWDNTYSIDPQSGYDISRYAGCRRRDYDTYKKQFEYLQPLWLEKLVENDDENDIIKFEFICYTIKSVEVNGEIKKVRDTVLSRKTLELTEDTKFGKYFYDWLRKLEIKGEKGNNKTAFVSFEDSQFAISGVNVTSGEVTGVIDLNYMMDNFVEFERPLIETDNMIIKTFRDHNTITSQLYNFNFCFNLVDIMDSQIYNIIQSNPVSIDCVVSIGGEPIKRTNIHTNYEYIDKFETLNFIPVGGTYYDGDSLNEIIEWEADDKTQTKLDDGSISRNVLDYLKDYEYPDFTTLNKLTQDIIHWGYTEDTARTFNLYNGYRGLLKYPDWESQPTTTSTGLKKYYYGLCYDDGSNNIACATNMETYGDMSNGLNWIQPGRVLYVSTSEDANNVLYYCSDYVDRYGVSVDDIAAYWSVDDVDELIIPDSSDSLEEDSLDTSRKLLFVYVKSLGMGLLDSLGTSIPTGYDDIHFIQSGGYDIVVTNNLDRLVLSHWIMFRGDSQDETVIESLLYKIMSLIEIIVYIGNQGTDICFKTEICSGKNEIDEIDFYKSKNHEHFPHRHSGSLVPFVCPDTYNYIYTVNPETNAIIRKEYINGNEFECLWIDSGWVRELKPIITYEFEAEYDESWPARVKQYLGSLYGLTSENDINYVFGLYDCDMNFTHIDEDTIDYKIKMNLL